MLVPYLMFASACMVVKAAKLLQWSKTQNRALTRGRGNFSAKVPHILELEQEVAVQTDQGHSVISKITLNKLRPHLQDRLSRQRRSLPG